MNKRFIFCPLNACRLSPFSIWCYMVSAVRQAVCWTLSAQEVIRWRPCPQGLTAWGIRSSGVWGDNHRDK